MVTELQLALLEHKLDAVARGELVEDWDVEADMRRLITEVRRLRNDPQPQPNDLTDYVAF